jgi:hypothetical protein
MLTAVTERHSIAVMTSVKTTHLLNEYMASTLRISVPRIELEECYTRDKPPHIRRAALEPPSVLLMQ